jgi:hypothetical protein
MGAGVRSRLGMGHVNLLDRTEQGIIALRQALRHQIGHQRPQT